MSTEIINEQFTCVKKNPTCIGETAGSDLRLNRIYQFTVDHYISKRMGCEGHVERIEEMRNAHKILAEKPETTDRQGYLSEGRSIILKWGRFILHIFSIQPLTLRRVFGDSLLARNILPLIPSL